MACVWSDKLQGLQPARLLKDSAANGPRPWKSLMKLEGSFAFLFLGFCFSRMLPAHPNVWPLSNPFCFSHLKQMT